MKALLTYNRSKAASIVAACFVVLAVSSSAFADSITFVYDTQITAGPIFTPGGPWGTITLTDSTVDPNRVDINISLNSAMFNPIVQGLNNFFLNFAPGSIASGLSFKLVNQTDPAGTFNGTAGDVNVNFNSEGPLPSMTLDIKLDPQSSTGSFFYVGSLVLREDSPPNHTEHNLDVSMFNLTDANGFYSAFNTLPQNQTFNYGARSTLGLSAVPEVGNTIGLLSLGLVGLVGLRAKFGRR